MDSTTDRKIKYWDCRRGLVEVTVDVSDALNRAVRALDATKTKTGWRYFDKASGKYWISSEDELVVLGGALVNRSRLTDVYSLWCASHTAEEG